MKRAVVFPDQHYPIHDVKAMSVAHQILREVKPDIFVNLGDVMEGSSVSSHRWKRRKRPPLEFQLPMVEKEIEEGNFELDKVDAILDEVGCKERFICQGNHDEYYDFFVEENSFLDHLTFRKAYKWDERGYKFKKYNEVLNDWKVIVYSWCLYRQQSCKKAFRKLRL